MLSLLGVTGKASAIDSRDCPTWYVDRDADGYGEANASFSRVSCRHPLGYVANNSDCNDFSALIYPGAPDAWWSDDGQCTIQEPAAGPLLFVNCNACAPGDLTCDPRLVGCSNPAMGCNFTTIQEGIDAALPGATVEVCQGIYPERIDFAGKAITVRGRLTHSVVIAGDGSDKAAVNFLNGEGSSSRLTRVNITAGLHELTGGGMLIRNASPVIEQVSFINNSRFSRGGALLIEAGANGKAQPLFRNVSFTSNRSLDPAYGLGGAVAVMARGRNAESSPVFEDVLFANNTARSGGALHVAAQLGGVTSPKLTRARFFGNRASGDGSAIAIDAWSGSGTIELSNIIVEKNLEAGEPIYLRAQNGTLPVKIVNSTFVGNDAAEGVLHGEAGPHSGSLDLTLENNLIVFNKAVDSVVNLRSIGTGPSVVGHYHYNDVFSNGYTGLAWPPTPDASHNVAFDPRFRGYDPASPILGDLMLSTASPAINAGNPEGTYNDAQGTRNDLGAYGGPGALWPADPIPFIAGFDSPEPGLEDMVLARLVYVDLASRAPSTVTCEEATMDGTPGEWVSFSADAGLSRRIDLLGLKADTAYRCFVISSSTGGMDSYAFEIYTPPLPLDLQGLWHLSAYETGQVRPGYTLFNVFPPSFNPHYFVIVDMLGDIRWYYTLHDSSMTGDEGFELDVVTADTAVDFIPETAQILYGGGMNQDALPNLVPLSPADPEPLANLTCASANDEIYRTCAGIEGSTLAAPTPDHDAILTPDRKRVLFICEEVLPLEGTTPEQYCTDAAYRQDAFSIEEWDISSPTQPKHTWRWSSRDQIAKCQLPLLPGNDPYHANGLWLENMPDGRSFLYLSLRHRNQVLKIDRSTGEIVYKLGALMEEDMCPAATMPDPAQCPNYDAVSTLCPGRYWPRFSLIHDDADTTCPSMADYAGPEEQDPQWFYGQHAPWVTRGEGGIRSMWLHDNGRDAPDNQTDPDSRGYSRAVRMAIDEEALEARVDWQYCRGSEPGEADTWFAPAWGSAYPVQRTDGGLTGHTLIASAHCTTCVRFDDPTSEDTFVAEVDESSKQVVWSLNLGQSNGTYRAERIDGCYRTPGRRDFFLGTNVWCVDLREIH